MIPAKPYPSIYHPTKPLDGVSSFLPFHPSSELDSDSSVGEKPSEAASRGNLSFLASNLTYLSFLR